jgi:hypothetical protein
MHAAHNNHLKVCPSVVKLDVGIIPKAREGLAVDGIPAQRDSS